MAHSQFKVLKSLTVALEHAHSRIKILDNDKNFSDSNSYYCEYREWIDGDYKIDDILFVCNENK